jgi:hypothetical protein
MSIANEHRAYHTYVAGVTYNNADGSSRQETIQKMSPGDVLSFNATKFNGEPAIELYYKEKMIGYLPKAEARINYQRIKNELLFDIVVETVVEKNGQ